MKIQTTIAMVAKIGASITVDANAFMLSPVTPASAQAALVVFHQT